MEPEEVTAGGDEASGLVSRSVVDGESEDGDGDGNGSSEEVSDAASASAGAGTDEGGSHGCVMVTVEAPRVWHASWDVWQTYLNGYCERTMQVLPI
ncbi:hypothetical protein V7S43_015998 [Phytophthora oleae]|uniref:Uncharacterized protein n=1 Tax=Phytophthora oleae TaxID=2107226 RepID=A0ABD3EYG8_9STRA